MEPQPYEAGKETTRTLKAQIQIYDMDAHVIETDDDIRPLMEEPYRHKQGPLLGMDEWHVRVRRRPRAPGDLEKRLAVMKEEGIAYSLLFPSRAMDVGTQRDKKFAAAFCRAYNDYAASVCREASQLKAVALLPFQDVPAAVAELRRAVSELGMCGAFAPAVGLRLPLGHPEFHPIYAEAERLGSMVACHATVRGPQYFGADGFDKFIEVHTLSHPVAQMIQLTGMIFEGVPEKYPQLRIGFMEAGCSWVPFWMDRMDEEWAKRGAAEAPLCRRKPSEYLKSGQLFFAAEGDEKSVPEVVRRLGNAIV